MKRMRMLLSVCIILTLIMAGCSKKANNGESTATPSGGDKPLAKSNVTLTISRWAGPHADAEAELIKEFTKETGIKVKMDAIDYGQLKQKQVLNMSGKTGEYDLVWAQEIWMKEYAKAGYLIPLDEKVNNKSLTGSDFDINDFNQGAMNIDTVGGKLYGLPTYIQTPILVYNKEQLETAGLQPPKTWEEALGVAKYFYDHGSGIALPAKQGSAAVNVWASLLGSNDGKFFDNNGRLNLDSEASIQTTEFWKNLVSYSMKGSTNWHWDDVAKALQFGQAPIGITMTGLLGQLEDPKNSKVSGKLGYSPVPYSKHPYDVLNFWNWCVTADSKHPVEAFRLAAWLTSKTTEKNLGLATGQIAALHSLFNDSDLSSKQPWLPAVGVALKNSDTLPILDNMPKMVQSLSVMLSNISVNGANPKQELQKKQKELTPLFSP